MPGEIRAAVEGANADEHVHLIVLRGAGWWPMSHAVRPIKRSASMGPNRFCIAGSSDRTYSIAEASGPRARDSRLTPWIEVGL